MTSQQILQSDLLDILFEKRNKLYGAYSLRRNYSMELIRAMGITASLVSALIFFVSPADTEEAVAAIKPQYDITQIDLPPQQKPEPPQPRVEQPAAPKQVKTEVFLANTKIVDDVKDPVATQDDLADAAFGSNKADGAPVGNIQPPAMPPVSGGTGDGKEEEEKPAVVLPSRQPQFPGGAAAWHHFLSSNLRPPYDLDAGERRTVVIRFSVDEEGVVTNFHVLQSGGSWYDNEVIRVLKKMPRWLPALQNGKPIAVSYTQPVTFASIEE